MYLPPAPLVTHMKSNVDDQNKRRNCFIDSFNSIRLSPPPLFLSLSLSPFLSSPFLSSPFLSSPLLYSTLLYSTLLYCTLLYSTLLYSTLLYSTLLYSTLLYSTLLYSTLLYFILLSSHSLHVSPFTRNSNVGRHTHSMHPLSTRS